jgi:hypothetical protein
MSLISAKKTVTLFGSVNKESKVYRVLPKNIESVKESYILQTVILCAHLSKEHYCQTAEDIPLDKLVDIESEMAASYFQGIMRGIVGLRDGKPVLENISKTGWMTGIWYVQSRALNNLKLNNLALRIPKQTGLFTYTSSKGKGLVMTENLALSELVNRTIDKMVCPNQLIKFCTLSPAALKARQVLKHKNPSSKKMIYLPSEITYLEESLSKVIDNLSKPVDDCFNAIVDRKSYEEYVGSLNLYNKKYAEVTSRADTVARSRYAVLFKKGVKGDQAARLELLTLEELFKFSPTVWDDFDLPQVVAETVEGFARWYTSLAGVRMKLKTALLQKCFNEWILLVQKDPKIKKALKEASEDHPGWIRFGPSVQREDEG